VGAPVLVGYGQYQSFTADFTLLEIYDDWSGPPLLERDRSGGYGIEVRHKFGRSSR
jgi:hypothetical protein